GKSMRAIASFVVVFSMAVPVFAQTSSPFAPPIERLGVYVLNSGSGLDTGCTFRSGSPLIVRFAVPATMNHKEVDSTGHLKDSAKLIDKSILGSTVRIR